MRSTNAFVVPTLCDLTLLEKCIASINKQNSPDFEVVLVVGRQCNPKSDILKSIMSSLEYHTEIIRQEGKGIIGAMNTIYSLPYNNIVLTDEDAIPDKSYFINSINLLENNNDIGCAFGKVNGQFPDSILNRFIRTVNTMFSRQALFGKHPFRYFNSIGLPSGGNPRSLKSSNQVEDYFPIGVSMSWKQCEIRNFRLPNYSQRGILYESYMAAFLYKKNLKSVFSKDINVKHQSRESLSRGLRGARINLQDLYKAPEMLEEMGYNVNRDWRSKILKHTLGFL